MAVTFGLNIASLFVQRGLHRSDDKVQSISERLASGQRINRPGDDPAGLAVAGSLDLDIKVKNQARANVNLGISLLQTADGAVSALRSLVLRRAELAEQAASGTMSNTQREALNKEYEELGAEIKRIAASTEFNEIDLLSGELSNNTVKQLISEAVAIDRHRLAISGNGRYALYNNTTDGTLEQIDLETNARTVIATGTIGRVTQSASGEKVAFWSNANLTGEDPSAYGQIYLWDRSSGELDQITDSGGTEFFTITSGYALALSADGSTLAFVGQTSYDENGNATSYGIGQGQIHTYDLVSETYNKLTTNFQTTNMEYMTLSADGSYLAFSSFNNLIGSNADNNEEIYLYDNVSKPNMPIQITNTTGAVNLWGLEVDRDGNVYFSTARDYTGENSQLKEQIFKYSYDTGSFSQLTNIQSQGLAMQTMSLDGNTLYFSSDEDILGTNPNEKQQIFEYNLADGSIKQNTAFTDNSKLILFSKLSSDGTTFIQSNVGGVLQSIDVSRDSLNIAIDTGSGEDGLVDTAVGEILGTLKGIGGQTLLTESAARGALLTAKLNIEKLGTLSANIGAGMQRLAYVNNALHSEVLAKQDAHARIVNADTAADIAELVKEQILQQFNTALLAQANGQSRVILELLKP